MQVNILEARNHLSRLIRAAQAGEEVIIANRGEPVAKLIGTQGTPGTAPAGESVPGSATALLAWLSANPLPAHLRRTHEEIEADIQTERDAWE